MEEYSSASEIFDKLSESNAKTCFLLYPWSIPLIDECRRLIDAMASEHSIIIVDSMIDGIKIWALFAGVT